MHISKLLTFVFILLMISCQEKNSESEIDIIRTEIQQSDEYAAYQESFDEFFNQIRNQDYDFFTVYHAIHDGNIIFDCSIDIPADVLDIDGGSTYWNSRCEFELKLKEVHERFPVLLTIDKKQKTYLLSAEDAYASKRVYDCIAQFQASWACTCDQYMDSDDVLEDYNENDIVDGYDKCCANGGSGCP